MSRLILFGDIHGCYQEWQDLLEKTGAGPSDRLVCVGDLVCKGPSSRRTLDMAMGMKNLRVVMGNHDMHLVHAWKKGKLNSLKADYQLRVIEELGAQLDLYMTFMEKWPLYLEYPECLVVHGGLRPGVALEDQSADDLLTLRTVEPGNIPWYELYHGKRLVVHGHWARQGLVVRENVIGLDTGCCYGKELTALILPERRLVSTPARKVYTPAGS